MSPQFAQQRIPATSTDHRSPKNAVSCRFPSGEDCSVGGGLFAVQCEAEGHGMVLKLGIKGGERWAGRIQHQLPLLLLLLLWRKSEQEVNPPPLQMSPVKATPSLSSVAAAI